MHGGVEGGLFHLQRFRTLGGFQLLSEFTSLYVVIQEQREERPAHLWTTHMLLEILVQRIDVGEVISSEALLQGPRLVAGLRLCVERLNEQGVGLHDRVPVCVQHPGDCRFTGCECLLHRGVPHVSHLSIEHDVEQLVVELSHNGQALSHLLPCDIRHVAQAEQVSQHGEQHRLAVAAIPDEQYVLDC